MTVKKIHIIGSVGSGKSTLARKLSAKLQIPYYELDNVVWERRLEGDIKRMPRVRDTLFGKIVSSDCWIIEGVHSHPWVSQSLRQAELIIYLDTGLWKRNYRILKRFVVQKLGFEQGNYKQSFNMLRKMYKWNYDFEKNEKPEILKQLKPFSDKLVFLKDNTDLRHEMLKTHCEVLGESMP